MHISAFKRQRTLPNSDHKETLGQITLGSHQLARISKLSPFLGSFTLFLSLSFSSSTIFSHVLFPFMSLQQSIKSKARREDGFQR
jgi:hypothetical protein